MDRIVISKSRFMDGEGRERMFNGLNLVCKDSSLNYVYPLSLAQYERLYRQGINLLRFGIYWAAVEPKPGVYDEGYLEKVREQLELAGRAGLRFYLDFHQDLYGVSFGGGAPDWAEVTDGLPHVTGDLWSDAYLISPALNRAIQHFWDNDMVYGRGLQDCFMSMLKYVVRFFQGIPGLLGYDLWNEPYPGPVGQAALDAAMELLPGAPGGLEQDGVKAQLIAGLTDMDFYNELTSVIARYTVPFEKDVLMPFYRQAADTIRSLDPEAFLFTEACYFTNMGVPSGIERLPDSDQVFAPHGYDLIVDTGHDDLYDSGRVELIFQRHKQTGDLLEVPTLIGEWGAFEGRPGNEEAIRQMIRILERNLWSHTYWSWRPDIEGAPEWGELIRAYPVATAGTLLYYRWEGDCITLEYDGVPGCTEVFVPNLGQGTWGVRRLQGDVRLQEHVWPDTKHGVLRIRSDRAQNVRLCFGRVAGAYGGAVHDPLDL